MSWRVLIEGAAQSDLDSLAAADRLAVLEEVADWVDQGPPQSRRRLIGGAVTFEDRLACGYTLIYFVEQTERYAGVLRIRQTMN